MDPRSRLRSHRRRWTAALFLAVVMVAVLVAASPAVAKPVHLMSPVVRSSNGVVVFGVCVAVLGAIALVLLAIVLGRGRRTGERAEVVEVRRAPAKRTHHGVAA